MFDTGDAVQLALKALFHAQLTNVLRSPVVRLVVIVFDFFFFALVDPPDIADHMAGQFTVGIIAKQARLDLHAGEAKTLGCKARHLDVRQAVSYRQRFKCLGFIQ